MSVEFCTNTVVKTKSSRMEPSVTSAAAPHSVKRWQLGGTDYEPAAGVRSLRSEWLLSAWTPLGDKTGNQQLFEERVNLVLHWFDLWSDRQRKHLMHSLLARCSGSQLKFCRDLLMEAVPVTRADFTAVLPRFLSLYVMSFLSPRDLCSAAQVCWHWRILAEQDCVWASRCIRRGWFLPYTPTEKEYGAWKSHYVSCVSSLDWLTPREAAKQYGTLNQLSAGLAEEEEERRKERKIRQLIRDKLQEEKRVSLRTRRAWGSNAKPESGRLSSWGVLSSWPWFSGPQRSDGSPTQSISLDGRQSVSQSLERVQTGPNSRRRNNASRALSSFTYSPAPPQPAPRVHLPSPALLLLVSNRVPAYELLLSGTKAGVIVVLYDHRGSLPALLAQAEGALSGRTAQRLGLLAPGGTEEVHMLQRSSLSERTLLTPDHRDFWEKLSGWVDPSQDGGGVDIFSPLGASTSGLSLIRTLSTLTGLEVRAPMGLATGSFQNILSEWCDGSLRAGPPDQQFVWNGVLQDWCRQAWWMEEVLGEMRAQLGPQLERVSLLARGRALAHFLCDKIGLEEVNVTGDLAEALMEGLAALTRQEEVRPVEFLAGFLTRWPEEGSQDGFCVASRGSEDGPRQTPQLPQAAVDWRGVVVRELHRSECVYVARLNAVLKVYQEPLAAALSSNRAILSFTDVQLILSPVAQLLELNWVFQADLEARLQRWGADRCVGDVFVKLCSGLRVYSNYFNNYTTALRSIDKCRETKPLFRAFLRQADRTLATHMMSLQELLLCPAWRIQEYVTLLQALHVHTHPGHPDRTHLSSALDTMLRLRESVQKLKPNSERDELLEETQRLIQGCPALREGNRQLIMTQDAALLRSPDEEIPESLRTFEEVSDVGLFLFSDALVLTRRSVQHTPFTLAHRSTYTFLVSVALSCLAVREITHTRYVSHAFVLEGPRRSWVCATARGEEREHFLSVLRSAIDAALAGDQ